MSFSFQRVTPLLLVAMIALTTACQGLAGEPRIVATIPPPSSSSSSTTNMTDADIAAVMTLGGEVWMGNCAECHGQTGLGTERGAPLPDLTNYSDEQILASISNGVRDVMPAFGSELTSDELTAAMTYAKMMSLAISRGMIGSEADQQANEQQAANPEVAQPAATEEVAAEDAVLGVVTGQATNGTAGASLPPEMTLTLHVIKSEISEESFDTIANPDGSYRFEGIPFDATYQYVVTAPHGDVMFVSQIASVDPAQPEINLPITVYEAGAPENAIQINGISSQVLVQNNALQMIEIVSFVNTSDRVYFSVEEGIGTSVRIHIPENARVLSNMNENYVLSNDGTQLYSSRPVLPGDGYAMHAAFSMPYDQSATVVQMLDYPLNGQVDVAVATDGVSLTGDGFTELGQIPSGSLVMTSYAAQVTQDAGTSIRYELNGAPFVPQSANPQTVSPLAYILIGAGISALLIAAIIYVRERMVAKPVSNKTAISDLMEQIATLDAQHRDGQIDAPDYERRRSALKSQLTALMKTE